MAYAKHSSNLYEGLPSAIARSFEVVDAEKEEDPGIITLIEARRSLIRRIGDRSSKQRKELRRCASDLIYWLDNWGWTYDPRRVPQCTTIPFVTFDRQKEYLRWLQQRVREQESGLVEKSRDTGLTWLNCGYAAHALLFGSGESISFGSRKAMLVDVLGNPDSILEKVRILLRNLPQWFGVNVLRYYEMRISNPANNSIISGEAGDNQGRGGRSSVYFLDEFAHVERADSIDASVSNNTNCVFYVSTPAGPANAFAQRRFSNSVPVFTLHWKEDPRKNHWELRGEDGEVVERGRGKDAPPGAIYPWYEIQKQRFAHAPALVAQELDIDYNASVEQLLIPVQWIESAVNAPIVRSGQRIAGMDVANDGGCLNTFVARDGPVVFLVDGWAHGNTTQSAFRARDLAIAHSIETLYYDSIGVGAGIRGALNSDPNLPFAAIGVDVGDGATAEVFDDVGGRAKTNKDVFINLRAEILWKLRVRFEKTYEYVTQGISHPHDEMISIPDHAELKSELQCFRYHYTPSGKIGMASKASMPKSPDFAEGLELSFAPGKPQPSTKWLDFI